MLYHAWFHFSTIRSTIKCRITGFYSLQTGMGDKSNKISGIKTTCSWYNTNSTKLSVLFQGVFNVLHYNGFDSCNHSSVTSPQKHKNKKRKFINLKRDLRIVCQKIHKQTKEDLQSIIPTSFHKRVKMYYIYRLCAKTYASQQKRILHCYILE